MGENWYTGIFYKVKSTKRIGELIECPCDDPIILEFVPGSPTSRRVVWLKEVEPASMPKTWENRKAQNTKPVKDERKSELRKSSMDKFLRIIYYMKDKGEPVTSSEIRKMLGFFPFYHLGNPSGVRDFSLETLGIVERVPRVRNWLAWQLTEKGQSEGEEIIKSKYGEGL